MAARRCVTYLKVLLRDSPSPEFNRRLPSSMRGRSFAENSPIASFIASINCSFVMCPFQITCSSEAPSSVLRQLSLTDYTDSHCYFVFGNWPFRSNSCQCCSTRSINKALTDFPAKAASILAFTMLSRNFSKVPHARLVSIFLFGRRFWDLLATFNR